MHLTITFNLVVYGNVRVKQTILNKNKMTQLELKEWITELACSLDRGDLKVDELMNEVEEVVDKNITEQLTLNDVVKSDSELLVWLQKSDLVTFPKDEINEVIDDYRFYQTNCG